MHAVWRPHTLLFPTLRHLSNICKARCGPGCLVCKRAICWDEAMSIDMGVFYSFLCNLFVSPSLILFGIIFCLRWEAPNRWEMKEANFKELTCDHVVPQLLVWTVRWDAVCCCDHRCFRDSGTDSRYRISVCARDSSLPIVAWAERVSPKTQEGPQNLWRWGMWSKLYFYFVFCIMGITCWERQNP